MNKKNNQDFKSEPEQCILNSFKCTQLYEIYLKKIYKLV